MIKILFVCHGNICRSPMAEFVMKDIVKSNGMENDFEIRSAASSNEEIGNPVYPAAKSTLARHGISCKGKYAVRMTAADYEYYDFIVAMDNENLRGIKPFVNGDKLGKVSLLMDFTSRHGAVADPWYTGDFDTAYTDICEGCMGLFEKIINNLA